MNRFIMKLLSFIFVGTVLINCSGAGGATTKDDKKQLLFKAPAPGSLVGLDSQDLSYQMVLYMDANGSKGAIAFGPAEVISYNVSENLYSARIDNVLYGKYIVSLQIVKGSQVSANTSAPIAALSDGSQGLILSAVELNLDVEGNEVSVDVTNQKWADKSFDDDADGLSNLNELKFGTNPNISDTDGDGTLDSIDAFPISASESFDFDGDGIGDNKDNDVDNDGLTNDEENLLGTNSINPDTDSDGVNDKIDNCPVKFNSDQSDIDKDGKGDVCDSDADGDGLSNDDEILLGTSPKLADTDGDGVNDKLDAFPKDKSETLDNDKDGKGDNVDTDDDNDGVPDLTEMANGTNPKAADTDGDGINDKIDNCVFLVNPGQNDNDGDKIGDDCDPDDDNDGLSDAEELVIGTDGFITNPKIADSDGDGYNDKNDNCPLAVNVQQTDTDNDHFGDVCDCGVSNSKINQLANDLPDPTALDANCDGIDGDKYKTVFVAAEGTKKPEEADQFNPTSDLDGALKYAATKGYSVLVSDGDYNISKVTLVDGVSVFGGYSKANHFNKRDITGVLYPTRLLNATSRSSKAALVIDSFKNPITIGGFIIKNTMPDDDQVGLLVKNSVVSLENNIFDGDDKINTESLLNISNSQIKLTSNHFLGKSLYFSNGFISSNNEGFVTNNLFVMGTATHTRGAVLTQSDLVFSNNTVDGGQHNTGSAYGVTFSDSIPSFNNNIFITKNNRDSASLYCEGNTPDQAVELNANAFYRYSTNGLSFAAYISCSGEHITNNTDLENNDEVSAGSNIVDTSTVLSGLSSIVDVANFYKPVTGSQVIDAGINTNSQGDGAVVHDFLGVTRVPTFYDIGATEF